MKTWGNVCRNCSHGWFKTTEDQPECSCGCHITFDKILKLSGKSVSIASQMMFDVMKEHNRLERTDPELMAVFDEIVVKVQRDPSHIDKLSNLELYILKQVSDKSKFMTNDPRYEAE